MDAVWILLIVTHVYFGSVVSSVEFSDRAQCYEAKSWVEENTSGMVNTKAVCIPRGGK